MRKKSLIIAILAIVLSIIAAAGYLFIYKPHKAEAPSQPQTAQQTESPATTEQLPEQESPKETVFNKSQYSLEDPTSIWVIVNKQRPLPSTYEPSDLINAGGGLLRAEAAAALDQLLKAAEANQTPMSVLSAYRSYVNQQNTYSSWVAKDGQAVADTYSARPGHSEHQTGLAADLGNGTCNLETCFGNTTTGQWLAANAYKYGFVIRYPNGKQTITGYQYEPWHIRYVGNNLAAEIQRTGLTLEEYFQLSPAPTYN